MIQIYITSSTPHWVQLSLLAVVLSLCLFLAYGFFKRAGMGMDGVWDHGGKQFQKRKIRGGYGKLHEFWAPGRVINREKENRRSVGGEISTGGVYGRRDLNGGGEKNEGVNGVDGVTVKMEGSGIQVGELELIANNILDHGLEQIMGANPDGKRSKGRRTTRKG